MGSAPNPAPPSSIGEAPGSASFCTTAFLLLFASVAQARVLEVGPARELTAPSAAAAIAQNGDTVRIDPGEYLDCAMWRADGLTIEGAAAGVVLSDKSCAGKALFVISGNGTTIRDLTLTRVRVEDGNGAGIRLEGRDLVLERVRFVNNQAGLLTVPQPASHIRITDSLFQDNGACSEGRCVGALMVGPAAELVIEGTRFEGTRGGHHIVSAATSTVLRSSHIADGASGTAGYGLQYVGAGGLRMEDNTLQKGPKSGNRRAEVLAGGAGWAGAASLELRRNRYTDDSGSAVPLLLNWTGATPVLVGNLVAPGGLEVSEKSAWLYRLRLVAVTARAFVVDAKDQVKHVAGRIVRAL